ncbi:Plcl2 [Symbiodinium sp. CCMP2592]|nr:Plcl2 [Symbiodinium sp. CCMP2592]
MEVPIPGHGSPSQSQEIRVLVFTSESDRDALASLLEDLQSDRRSFRRRGASLLACLPGASNCLAGCVKPLRKAPTLPHDISELSARLSRSGDALGKTRPDKEGCTANLDDFKAFAKQMFDRHANAATMRRSGSLGDISSAFRQYSRRKETKESHVTTNTRASANTGTGGPSAKGVKDQLPPSEAANLLHRLLFQEDGPPAVDGQGTAGYALFPLAVTFESFWSILQPMLFTEQLLTDPKLHNRLGDGGSMSLEKWSWFLVQVQNEERAVVEGAAAQLKDMEVPYVDDEGQLSVAGLSCSLCSPDNGALKPDLYRSHDDMTRPLTEYWIASAHHVLLELAPPSPEGPNPTKTAEDKDKDGQGLRPVTNALRAGCRCISLALLETASELQVVLQQKRVPLADVLELISSEGFQTVQYPLLLVLCLRQLPSSQSRGQVAEVLFDKLGDRLWRSGPEMPSPEAAKGHVVVVLAPACDMDPALEPPRPPMRKLQKGYSTRWQDAETSDEVVEAWQEAANRFAVWCGQVFDRKFAQQPPGGITVGFLPSDELCSLAEFKQQTMLEYHRQYLTLTFPLAPRDAPVNYNLAAAWSCGVQMAAMTVASGGTRGDGATLVQAGLFSLNGGCGYVLKPPYLRNCIRQEDSLEVAAPLPKPIYLEVRLLAARAVPGMDETPWPRGPVVLSASIWGAPSDCARQDYQSIRATGAVLAWPNAAGLGFNIASPQVAILVMELFELDSSSGGYHRVAFFASPVHGLRQGLRWMPLRSHVGAVQATLHGPLSGILAHISLVEGGTGIPIGGFWTLLIADPATAVYFLAAALLRSPFEAATSRSVSPLLTALARLLCQSIEAASTQLEKPTLKEADALERRNLRALRGPLRRWRDQLHEGSKNSQVAVWVSNCIEALDELSLY